MFTNQRNWVVCATRLQHDQILLAVYFVFCFFFLFVFSVSSGLAILFDTFVLRRKNFTTLFAVLFFFFFFCFLSYKWIKAECSVSANAARRSYRYFWATMRSQQQQRGGALVGMVWCDVGGGFPPFAHCVLCWESWKSTTDRQQTFLKFVLTWNWKAIYINDKIVSA